MQFQEYVSKYRGKKVPADIQERWKTRILSSNLDKLGEEGAQIYLDMYGKSIGAPKCVLLAIQAENSGCSNMAIGFWKKAAELEAVHVIWPGESEIQDDTIPTPEIVRSDENVPDFGAMQPGYIAPMQPVDGKQPREYYIQSPYYWGQPKRDGNKLIVFATANKVWYQSRTMKLRASPLMDVEMKRLASLHGSFIAEGEIYYADIYGKEHRTATQANTYNVDHGSSELPKLRFMSFSCLFYGGDDLRSATYADRIRYNEIIFPKSGMFYAAPTCKTVEDKKKLATAQKLEGREGEIWFCWDLAYEAGKHTSDLFIRTKYLLELNALVTALTPTTAQGRLFGAIEISDLYGNPIGNIGTGFDRGTQQKIVERFKSGRLVVPVVCQGMTEYGQCFLPRLSEEFA